MPHLRPVYFSQTPLLGEVRPPELGVIWNCLTYLPISSQVSPTVPALRSAGQIPLCSLSLNVSSLPEAENSQTSPHPQSSNPPIALYTNSGSIFQTCPSPETLSQLYSLNWWPVISRISHILKPLFELFLPFRFNQNQFKPIILTSRESLPSHLSYLQCLRWSGLFLIATFRAFFLSPILS